MLPLFFYVMIYQNYSNLLYMIKKESVTMKRKRIECNNHGKPFKYHCQSSTCESPYLCGEGDCIDNHFHEDGRLILIRFDSKLWQSKFQEVDSVLNNETLKVKEENLAKLVDYFTQSLQKIQQEMSKFQEVKSKICEHQEKQVTPQYFENINGFLSLGCKLERKIDSLRAKIIDEDISFDGSPPMNPQPIEIIESNSQANKENKESQQIRPITKKVELEKNLNTRANEEQNQIIDFEDNQTLKLHSRKNTEYYENPYLTAFLRKHISRFEWTSSEIIFSSHSQPTTCEKFHEKLKDRKHLLFLFLGDIDTIGSYYIEPYPSIAEKTRKDNKSFIFINDSEFYDKFAIFFADSQSESHITISEKLLICQGNTPNSGDGLRTFQRNFESLAYFMPSISFNNPNVNRQRTYNGVLKIKEFYILQLLNQ